MASLMAFPDICRIYADNLLERKQDGALLSPAQVEYPFIIQRKEKEMKLKMCLLLCCILSSSTVLAQRESSPTAPEQPDSSQTAVDSESISSQPVSTQVVPDDRQQPMRPQSWGIQFVFWLFILIPIAIICYCLAKEKGRNTILWLILGFIPLVNFYALLYLVGSEDRDLKNKIQEIRQLLQK